MENFINKIDWALLREQKETLNNLYNLDKLSFIENLHIKGIIKLIDSIQDYAVDEICINEKEVFNLNNE